jgi:hypothetical protein
MGRAYGKELSPKDEMINASFATVIYGVLSWATWGYLYYVPGVILCGLALVNAFSLVATAYGYEAINPFEPVPESFRPQPMEANLRARFADLGCSDPSQNMMDLAAGRTNTVRRNAS